MKKVRPSQLGEPVRSLLGEPGTTDNKMPGRWSFKAMARRSCDLTRAVAQRLRGWRSSLRRTLIPRVDWADWLADYPPLLLTIIPLIAIAAAIGIVLWQRFWLHQDVAAAYWTAAVACLVTLVSVIVLLVLCALGYALAALRRRPIAGAAMYEKHRIKRPSRSTTLFVVVALSLMTLLVLEILAWPSGQHLPAPTEPRDQAIPGGKDWNDVLPLRIEVKTSRLDGDTTAPVDSAAGTSLAVIVALSLLTFAMGYGILRAMARQQTGRRQQLSLLLIVAGLLVAVLLIVLAVAGRQVPLSGRIFVPLNSPPPVGACYSAIGIAPVSCREGVTFEDCDDLSEVWPLDVHWEEGGTCPQQEICNPNGLADVVVEKGERSPCAHNQDAPVLQEQCLASARDKARKRCDRANLPPQCRTEILAGKSDGVWLENSKASPSPQPRCWTYCSVFFRCTSG